MGVYLNSNSDAIDGVTSVNTGVDVLDGQWHHLAVSWSSVSGTLTVYKDGVQAYQSVVAGGSISPNGSLVLAQDQDSVGGGFDATQRFIGELDEVAFNSGNLAADVIADLYDAGIHTGGGNVISGNTGLGVELTGTADNVIAGNYIGTNAAGTAAISNGGVGVILTSGANTNTIGGTTAAARNVISGNASDGVLITGSGTTGNQVLGNSIGTTTGQVSPVVPAALTTVEGDATAVTNVNSPARFQQMIEASEFSGPVLITALRFHPMRSPAARVRRLLRRPPRPAVHHAAGERLAEYDLRRQRRPGRRDGVRRAAHHQQRLHRPGQRAEDFDVVIPLQTPFYYNPAAGNLLYDFRTFSGSDTANAWTSSPEPGRGRL